jgi:ribosomal protein L17
MKSIVKTNDKKALAYRTGLQFANEAIKGFCKNGKVCGLTNGAFSLLSLIKAVLDITGTADVTISTWSAGLYDAGELNSLMTSGHVRDVRLILDRSFKTRQAGYALYIQDVFKDENIRTTNTHAKFVLIRNAEYNVCIRSSMNLNENKRCENFDIDDDLDIYNLFNTFADDLFSKQRPGIIESRAVVDPVFDGLFGIEYQQQHCKYYKVLD